ncbi:uncharacterized protein LOC119074912 [Bradysia coprophila]|uniref:uncharacterized protein LOC119074912 n=1 Tax=Bradysia coprophila TaxID=38358 RepID=UPI00187DBDB4|nr:uncharacterized protein LOC119074912 [Bradysia coprophila]XP_037037178.1 uncharacterized protein LOC119074912 [Bradysia coprophila]
MDRAKPQCSNEGCKNDFVVDIFGSLEGHPDCKDWIEFLKDSSVKEGDGKWFCLYCSIKLSDKFKAQRTRNEADSSGIQNEVPIQKPNDEDEGEEGPFEVEDSSSSSSSTGTLVTVGSLESENSAQSSSSSTQNQDIWVRNNIAPLNLSEPDSSNDA